MKDLYENSKIKWHYEQELQMAEAYQNQGIKSWKIICNKINEKFGGLRRTPKQCRQRYNNYVKFRNFGSTLAEWTQKQFDILLQKYQLVGSKWVQISKFLQGKSQNTIKNRFYCTLRKLIRRIHKIQKKLKMKKQKLFKQTIIIQLLENNLDLKQGPQKGQLLLLHENIKNKIIILLKIQQCHQQQQLIMKLIRQIQELKEFKKFSRLKTRIQTININKEIIKSTQEDIQYQQKEKEKLIPYSQEMSDQQLLMSLNSQENTSHKTLSFVPRIQQIELKLIDIDEIERYGLNNQSIFNLKEDQEIFYFNHC